MNHYQYEVGTILVACNLSTEEEYPPSAPFGVILEITVRGHYRIYWFWGFKEVDVLDNSRATIEDINEWGTTTQAKNLIDFIVWHCFQTNEKKNIVKSAICNF